MLLLLHSVYRLRDPDTIRRVRLAQSSWRTQPWTLFPVADDVLPRLFTEGHRKFPYFGDLADAAVNGSPDDTIIVYLNADVGVMSDCALKIVTALQINDATYCFRRDAHHKLTTIPGDDEVRHWHLYAGTDLFAFRSNWWRAHRKEWPDLVLGREAWDACLRVLMEATCPVKPVAVVDCCFHERHTGHGYWETPSLRYSLAGQKHNLKLAKSFVKRFGYRPEQFGIK